MEQFVNIEENLEEIKSYLPHYVFYRRGYKSPDFGLFGEVFESEKNSKTTDCYCTACHQRYEDTVNPPSAYKHKAIGTCAMCGATVERRSMGRGRHGIREEHNFAVFEGAGDLMRISCIKAWLTFPEEGELEPYYDWYEVTRYQLEPHKAVQYRYCFNYCEKQWYEKTTKPSSPNFANGGFYIDNSYTLINTDALEHSFLKYIDRILCDRGLPTKYMEWLCRYAEHPQLEYFCKADLFGLAEAYVEGRMMHRIRFNWRSNDLKKILRLTKPELSYIQETDGRTYPDYINFRRSTYQGKTAEETIRYYKEFHLSTYLIDEIHQLTQLAKKKIMDYAQKKQNKEGTYFLLTCWRDYLRDCQTLNYDLTDTSILMPKHLFTMHDRVAKIIKVKADEVLKKKMADLVEARRDMEVTDMELGLLIRQPYTIKEIVQEGKKLHHCVGGYADRHAEGKLTILFIRKLSEPHTPYYTMEVDLDLKIVQCRGYKNNMAGNPKPELIKVFEERFQDYLDIIRMKRKAAAKKKKFKQRMASAAA